MDFFSVSFFLKGSFVILLVILLMKFMLIVTRQTTYAKMIDAVPGPKALPILGNAWDLYTPHTEILSTLVRITNLFPNSSIIRAWLGFKPYVIIKDGKAAKEILCSMQHITKGDLYHLLHSMIGQGLVTATGTKWHESRKMLNPAFHVKMLEEFNAVFNKQANILIKNLNQMVGKGTFDIYSMLTDCALDIICESAVGVCVNAQQNNASDFVTSLNRLEAMQMTCIFQPWLLMPLIYDLFSWGCNEKHHLKIIHNFTRTAIKERSNYLKINKIQSYDLDECVFGQKKITAILDLLLLTSWKEGDSLTDQEIIDHTTTFIIAGHETTASNLFFTLYLLATHPIIQKRVQEEIDQAVGSEEILSQKHLLQLKYMEAVIKESLRLYPPGVCTARKLTEDLTLAGYHIPAETNIAIFIYGIHHDPEIFPNPEIFDPLRFLTEKNETRNLFSYIPFSAGPRNCIGQKYAIQEVKVILTKILQNFNIFSQTSPADMKLEICPVLKPSNCFIMNLERRQQ